MLRTNDEKSTLPFSGCDRHRARAYPRTRADGRELLPSDGAAAEAARLPVSHDTDGGAAPRPVVVADGKADDGFDAGRHGKFRACGWQRLVIGRCLVGDRLSDEPKQAAGRRVLYPLESADERARVISRAATTKTKRALRTGRGDRLPACSGVAWS